MPTKWDARARVRTALQLRVEGYDLPGSTCGPSPVRPQGHSGIHVGVQRRGKLDEWLGLTSGDAETASWTLPCTVSLPPGSQSTYDRLTDLRGPYVQGPPGGRFLYLSWVAEEGTGFVMFRRGKILFNSVPPDVLETAARCGVLGARVRLTDGKGNPSCASFGRGLTWSAG